MYQSLLQPLPSLGLSHRALMAPLTRVRANERFECGPTAAQYYSERASPGGLVITEGAPVSPETQYEYAAGIYTPEQEAGWKKVVDAVHAKGGKISIQLWHLGRMAHSSWAQHPFLMSLGRPLPSVSSSSTIAPGATRGADGKKADFTPARELSAQEIRERLVQDFTLAAQAAQRCGFDFAEIHAAHGYLFNQFFCDSTNQRTDEFGCQSIENRTRALSLVLKAVIGVFGDSKKVAVRVSPTFKDSFSYQGCGDSDPENTYRGVIKHLSQYKLGYLLITEPRWHGGRGNFDVNTDQTFKMPLKCGWVKQVYGDGVVVGSSSFTPEAADQAIREGTYDAVAFGRFFISNPDLPRRLSEGRSLNVYDTNTFYIRDDVKGYVDYPGYHNAKTFPQISTKDIGAKVTPKKSKL